jgi:stage IV sporulation protein FB
MVATHPGPSGFKLAGIPVHVKPAFFLTIVVLGAFSYPPAYVATWVAIATISVVVHEFGHAIAFRVYGLAPSVTLHAMGGLTTASLDEHDAPPFTPVRSIVTSLAGPLSALLLFGVPALLAARGLGFDPLPFARAYGPSGELYVLRSGVGPEHWMLATPVHILVGQAVYINIYWSLLNLVPVLPLDGGNVTAGFFELFSPRHGRRIANVLSIAVAAGLALWGISSGNLIGPLLGALLVGMNVSELAGRRHEDVDGQLVDAARALVEFDPLKAEGIVSGLLDKRVAGDRRRVAVELFAWARLAQGDAPAAEQALAAMGTEEGPTATVRAAVSLARGRTSEGVTTMAWALAHDPDRSAKVLGAIALAQSGQVEAVTQELLLLGPAGREGGQVLAEGLRRTGHVAEAARVGQLLAG